MLFAREADASRRHWPASAMSHTQWPCRNAMLWHSMLGPPSCLRCSLSHPLLRVGYICPCTSSKHRKAQLCVDVAVAVDTRWRAQGAPTYHAEPGPP